MSARSAQKREYRELAEDVSRVLAEWDPYCLVESGAPRSEFDSEAIQLLPGLAAARSPADVVADVSRVFSRAFGPDGFSPEACQALGERLYAKLHSRAAELLLPRGTG
jgi:hypothetical protein